MVYTVCKKKKFIAHGLPVGAPPGKNVKLRLCTAGLLKQLPGVGRYTAGAIGSIALGQVHVFDMAHVLK